MPKPAPRPSAFVVMPFAAEFDHVFHEVIRPTLSEYDVCRADTRLDERGILEKIITGIRDADLIVADVSNSNANVCTNSASHTRWENQQ